jgi:CBS domain-containing protein
MELGPSTFRPDATLDQPLAYMRRRSRSGVLVTLSDGRLVGFLTRADAEHAEAKGER